MADKQGQRGDTRGIFSVLLVLVILVAAGGLAYRHYHSPTPAASASSDSANSQDFNTPPVPGTENVRAEPLDDNPLARHLDDGPTATPGTISPTNMKTVYSIPSSPSGAGTIAIVDAYDDPAAEQDLASFDSNYSINSCTTANGCFEKHMMAANLPVDTGWVEETSLDTQWAHAIAPNARILLVEAKTNLISDLMNAVDYARSRVDVVAVSMSWGSNEFVGETGYDSRLTSIHGAAFFAAAGDSGHNVWWPAAAPTVIGVGGTTLTLSGGSFSSETAWSGSGGGVSIYESEPSFQSTYGISGAGGFRGTPDVSYAGDPSNGGVPVYISVPISGYSGWWTIGGTSAGTPQWAALQAITRRITLARLYTTAAGATYSSFFRDITSGNNGGCGGLCNAGTGYDYVTGLGSPLSVRY